MIKLFSFGPAFGLPDPSPFVTKVDLYMRMNGIEFVSKPSAANLQKAPKGKLPFIEDDGEIIADSVFIFSHLNKKYNIKMDDWLTTEQKATAQLISKSLDENFYWSIVHSRWANEDTWPLVKKEFFDPLPFPLKHIVPVVARRSTLSQLSKHGIGKHSDAEIRDIAKTSLESLSILLGEKPYIFGDKPCSLDITIFAMTSSLVLSTIDNEMNSMARKFSNIETYCQKILETYYSD